VEICVAAPRGTKYWIVSRADGPQLFAKKQIDGHEAGIYRLTLRNDTATSGSYDCVVVAARAVDAQRGLADNVPPPISRAPTSAGRSFRPGSARSRPGCTPERDRPSDRMADAHR
jgi:hypothetical protein